VIRIGVDFGGTKIEAAALDREGNFLARVREPNPGNYDSALATVKELVEKAEQQAGGQVDRVGVGMPGSISPVTGEVRGANSTWLNGKPFDKDLAAAMGKTVRVANDANCFALSEATDGAGKDATVVFGVIIGTGCGGGVVSHKHALDGKNFIAGEWGHTPLPWLEPDEYRSQKCWCGRWDCLERYVAGSAFVNHYKAAGGDAKNGAEIVERARAGEAMATSELERYINRLGRGLAMICDILDPDVIVLGGGMSNTDELYTDRLRKAVEKPLFSDQFITPIRRPVHGDSSGVRGAAWLWPWD
jgi:fructokinase